MLDKDTLEITSQPCHTDGPLTQRLRTAIEHAVAAPSSHNTQPWKFRLLTDGVELFADRGRSLPVVDPADRALTISCGAALYHLRLAMNCDHLATLVRVFPDPMEPDLVARILVSGYHAPSEDDQKLFEAIPLRRTNRKPFADKPVEASIKKSWLKDADESSCWLYMTEDSDEKRGFAELIDKGDRLQASDGSFRRELAEWVHSNRSSRRDGMPGHSHGFGDLASRFGRLVIRTFDWGDGQAAKDCQLAEGSPLIAVLGTRQDTPPAWVQCGQALAKMLLRGTIDGLDASFMNQPIELSELRPRLAELVDDEGYPQILLRWGKGPEVLSTPRRDLDEVLLA